MKKNIIIRSAAVTVGAVLSLGGFSFLAGCGSKDTYLTIMTEDLNELYNPFYSTAGTDMDVVGQTQISMLSTDANGNLAFGNTEPTLVLDYESRSNAEGNTEYYFVLKNGLKFSDGVPVTMNDVFFNLYVYLDPAYTGSSTMYSTEILGLQEYRTQQRSGGSSSSTDDPNSESASIMAQARIKELSDLFADLMQDKKDANQMQVIQETEMEKAIQDHTCRLAYLKATGIVDRSAEESAASVPANQEAGRKQLLDDYSNVREKFKKELQDDFKAARNSYTEEPYKSAEVTYQGKTVRTGFDDVISFLFEEGYVDLSDVETCYGRTDGKVDKTKLVKVPLTTDPSKLNQDNIVDWMYGSKIVTELDQILLYWGSGTQLRTEYASKAMEILLHDQVDGDSLQIKNISGIVSLGHSGTSSITVNNHDYKVATQHNEDGTPKNAEEYDVLRITVKGTDPKAQWNFGFTVAPYHYYSDKGGTTAITKQKLADKDPLTQNLWNNVTEVDIPNNKFGVAWTDFDFQEEILQGDNSWGVSKNTIPLGAGPYAATDANDNDKPSATGFWNGSVVFYKSNPNFSLDGKTSSEPKVKHMRYQVTPIANALSSLESGQVHFVSPQYTKDNITIVNGLSSKGFEHVDSWQLGYGYIGINAGEVKQLGLRKAIMSAMQASLALQYYDSGMAVNIAWPMSAVNWAYPRQSGHSYDGNNPTAYMETDNSDPENPSNNHDYTKWTGVEDAKAKVQKYMQEAGSYDKEDLKLDFTIAGANMYDHPAYFVFKQAMDILNECGWEVNLKPDASALMKLSTGGLAVWAAAWGSTIDPDMYQVYHKNSTATSTLAWGYDDIKADQSTYVEENRILTQLSTLIDEARTTTNQDTRTSIYKRAMSKVLDLAIEFPLYQRKVLYVFNTKVIKRESLPLDDKGNVIINPYTSPLSRIWEIELTK